MIVNDGLIRKRGNQDREQKCARTAGEEIPEEEKPVLQEETMKLESLEQMVAERGRWKMTAILLLIALAAVLAQNARADLPYPERVRARTVEAEEVVLKDSSGKVRARMEVQGSAARLVIFDEDGKAIAVLPERARWRDLGK